MEALRRAACIRLRASGPPSDLQSLISKAVACSREHLEGMPEIRNWTWTQDREYRPSYGAYRGPRTTSGSGHAAPLVQPAQALAQPRQTRGPPAVTTHRQHQRWYQHGTHRAGIQQDAEGHDEPDLGQRLERQSHQHGEGC